VSADTVPAGDPEYAVRPGAAVAGIRLGTSAAGIRYTNREDLLVVEISPGSECAAVFTRNAFCAAPVTVARSHLGATAPRYLLVNSGNANAGTGEQGLRDAEASCRLLADLAGVRAEEVLPFSTGVIGEALPVDRIAQGLPKAIDCLAEDGWSKAAACIMTTDTVPKLASRRIEIGGNPVVVTGMAKGAGMICPDMATMLAYVATDAAVDRELIKSCLKDAVATSFNAITVDGDTSTNDACVLIATGRAGNHRIVDRQSDDYRELAVGVEAVCGELAAAIVRDGEGATKFVEIMVEAARDSEEARRVAYTVANSPLVKTALFASDPNWGRILAAVGRAGVEDLAIERVEIWLGDVCIVRGGGRAPEYTEEAGQEVMRRAEILIRIRLDTGSAGARVLTCDFSYDYVRINAEYRT